MKTKIKPVIGRVGGKARLAPWILQFIKEHNFSIYVEPFCGSSAIYFALLNEGIPEQVKARGRHFRAVLNDADREIMNLYKTVRDYPELLAYSVYFTPYSRAEHKDSQSRGSGDRLEDARQYLTDGWQSFTYDAGNSWGTERGILAPDSHGGKNPHERWDILPSRILTAAPHLGESEAINPYACLNAVGRQFVEPDVDFRVEWVRRYLVDGWQSSMNQGNVFGYETRTHKGDSNVTPNVFNKLPSRILTASPHLQENLNDLKKVYLECDDFEKVMRRWDTPETLHYADAPYYDCEKYYAHKFNREDHLRLCQTAHEMEGQVILSYYPHDEIMKLYSEDDWHFHYKETVASSAGITRNSKTKTRPKRVELLLVRKQRNKEKTIINLSGQMSLF